MVHSLCLCDDYAFVLSARRKERKGKERFLCVTSWKRGRKELFLRMAENIRAMRSSVRIIKGKERKKGKKGKKILIS
jgi:hypothetical protein